MENRPYDATVTLHDNHTGAEVTITWDQLRRLSIAAGEGRESFREKNLQALADSVQRAKDAIRPIAFPHLEETA